MKKNDGDFIYSCCDAIDTMYSLSCSREPQ